MSFTLRPDQAAMRQSAVDLLRQKIRRILLQAPTGFGKTVLATKLLANAAAKNHPAWFVLHRRELVNQTIETFQRSDLAHGVIARGYTPDRRPCVQIASIGTLARRMDLYGPPSLIVLDECHHVAAESWSALALRFPKAVLLGLSATPRRLDGTGLHPWFDAIVPGPSVRTLIDEGSLSPYRLFVPESVREDAKRPIVTGNAIAEYRKRCDGALAIVFCVSRVKSKEISEQFRDAGIPAMHVDGDTPDDLRDKSIKDFRAGKIRVLTNVDLFGEGFDVPGVEAIIDMCPTDSLTKTMQRWGRALRSAPGKTEAIILDHAGNSIRHGLPDDEREWSLQGMRDAKKKALEDPTRQCPMCYAVMRAHVDTCRCGFIFEARPRVVDEVDGELVESAEARNTRIAREEALREQGRAKSFEDLVAVGRSRGMKNPEGWARHLIEAREAKKQRGIAA